MKSNLELKEFNVTQKLREFPTNDACMISIDNQDDFLN